jgi:plasmid stabilization system protein ParE
VKHVIRPAARADIVRQFRHYLLEEAFDLADKFVHAVDDSIESLCRMPEMGAAKQSKIPPSPDCAPGQ